MNVRTWAYVLWTLAGIGLGIVARFTVAAPQPSCSPDSYLCFNDFGPLVYVALFVVWMLGIAVIVIVTALSSRWPRSSGRSLSTSHGGSESTVATGSRSRRLLLAVAVLSWSSVAFVLLVWLLWRTIGS
jgi:hypothetical protein